MTLAIKRAEDDPTVKIISSEISSMASPGDHFMSNMFAANVQYTKASESKDVALVIKAVPESEINSKLAAEGNFFELEITMLKDVSPALENILQKLPFGSYEPFSPRYVYSQKTPVVVIVMENLKKLGFRMLERVTGLDYEHSLLVMKTLARYHAASVVLNRDNPQMLLKFKQSDPCLALRIALDSASKLSLQNLEREIETWPEYKDKYCHKIRNMTETASDQWYDSRKRNDEDFNVLAHSDLWINNMMFHYCQETGKMICSDINSMASPGDNFMSNMYRAIIQYSKNLEPKCMTVVIKAIPEKGRNSELAEEGNFFETEITMLRDVLPAMYEILQKIPSGHYQPFSPSYLYSHNNPMLDRAIGLDYDHSLIVIKTLARYHAASVVLNRENPQLLEKIKNSDPGVALRVVVQSGSELFLTNLEKEIENWPGYKEKYCHKLRMLRENAVDDWFDARRRNEAGFNVLTHSDLWLNNIMFRCSSETGKVESARFIDYPCTYWTSPVVDILYFLNTSTAISITDKHQILIEEYHKELSNILTYFSIPHPTLEELFKEMDERSAIGVHVALGFRAIVMAEKKQVTELITEVEEDQSFRFSEHYKHSMRVLLPIFDQKGKMANTPPSWLNNEFLEKALRCGEKDQSLAIVSFDIKPATVAGDNYASEMFRVTIKVKRRQQLQETSVIVKTMPSAEGELTKMANTPPSWLNNEFLENALRCGEKDQSLAIVSFDIKPATVAGDNYASEMFRVTIKVKRRQQLQETSFIVKTMPSAEGELTKIIENSHIFIREIEAFSHIFIREIEAFSQVMPAMQALFDEVCPGMFQPFAAKYIFSSTKPQPTSIVLEDLKRNGFKLAEVDLGLDLKHSLLVMRTIARYHAVSLVLNHRRPGCFSVFMPENVFAKDDSTVMDHFVGSNMKCFAAEVDKWEDYRNKYSQILHSMAKNSSETWPRKVRRDDAGFNVLAHGDMWLNNMMFKYSEGEVQDISVSPDILENRDVLIKEYYRTLCKTLSYFGEEKLQPTLDVINKELENRCQFGVMSAVVLRLVVLSDRTKVPDLNKVFANENWMNDEFLEKSLQHHKNYSNIKVISSRIERASAAGGNFASEIYRAIMKVKRKDEIEEMSVIIKTALLGGTGEVSKFFQESDYFIKEIGTLSHVVPAMKALFGEVYSENYKPFGAECFFCTTTPQPTLILEDLKKKGFRMAEFNLGLDLKHALLVLRSIASYHACSLVLFQNDSQCFKAFQISPQTAEVNVVIQGLLDAMIKSFLKEIENWPEQKERYYDILKSISDTSLKIWIKGVKRVDDGFNVLNHGDLWVNNMMFKYSEETGVVEDVSISPDVLETHRDKLIIEYHKTLSETLSQLGYKGSKPTLQTINEELENRSLFAVVISIVMRIIALPDKANTPNLDQMVAEEGTVFLSDRFKTAIKILLPLFEKWEKALRSEGNDPSISVITSEIKPATAAGDNFASDMFRASLKIRRKEKIQEVSLIIKTLPSAAEMAKMERLGNVTISLKKLKLIVANNNNNKLIIVIDESPSFAKETQYFSVIMPAQQSLINETYSAKYFYSTTKPKSIVLEDLKKSGFKMADVSLGLDLKHTLLVLKTLARFHATSHVLYQSNQHYFDEYLTSKQTDEQNMPMKTFLHTNVPCLAEEVQKWEEFKEKYYKPLLSLADTSFELWLRCYKRDEHGFNVLAHADLWFNNIMFKYSEESGEVEDKVKQKTFEPFAAKHVFSTSSPEPDAIVLQDLKREGFKLPQVNLGLDLNHSLLVMRTIARFHACSVALYQSRPELLKSFETSMQVSYSNPYFKNFMASNLKTVSQELERLTEYKKYCSVLDSLVDTCQDRFIEAGTRDDNSFNVLIHGDLWFNNMMFKYNEETGDVQAVRFVDFQLNYHTSPVVDLLYFFNTSVSPDVLQNHDILIEEYYQTLCEILTDIGYGDFKPTKELLVAEFNKKAIIGVLAGLTVRVVAFTEKAPDMEKLVNNEERVFLSDRYLRAVKKLLPMYEKLGWLTL
ncbi:hypothetical protein C0J52_17002 [Blattella germanica]|nr:hypothetical protein C0J52_17002 [Blattella germanica]